MMERRIVNTWDQIIAAGGTGLAIFYLANTGRGSVRSRWHVWRLVNGREVATHPGASWYDYGRKTFVLFGRTRKEALQEAIAWTEEQYGPQDFVRNRMGDYVPRAINAAHPIPAGPPKER